MESELTWINKEFLEDVFKQYGSTIMRYEINQAVGKGENRTSVMKRIKILFEENYSCISDKRKLPQTYYIIVKSLPSNERLVSSIVKHRLFEKEIHMYQVTLPALNAVLQELQPSGLTKPFNANFFPVSRSNTLVFEDLTQNGFKMADRRNGLDLDHCFLALEALARFHATSVAIGKRHPEIIEFYTESSYTEQNRDGWTKFMDVSFGILVSVVNEWPGYEKYSRNLADTSANAFDKLMQIVKPKEEQFNVLNHGDFWVNNMLFKYSDSNNKVEDIRLVDFQACRYSSPSLDLLYFMYTSPNNEVRENHMDQLLEHYHRHLVSNLLSLDIESAVYTLDNLKRDIKNNIFFGIYTACIVLPIVLIDPENCTEVEKVTKESQDSSKDKLYRDTRFRNIFQKLLLHFSERGVL